MKRGATARRSGPTDREMINMFFGCRVCGTGAHLYRDTCLGLEPTCRECFRKDNSWVFTEALSTCKEHGEHYEERPTYRNFLFEKAIRQILRNEREKAGIKEPAIRCRVCRRDLPMFEFGRQYFSFITPDWNNLVCYECGYEMKETKWCPRCERRVERPGWYDFTGGYVCSSCEDGIYKERRERQEGKKRRYLTRYSDRQCIANLKMRAIEEPTPELIEAVREIVLSKRVLGEIRRLRRRYESGSPDVQREQ